MRGLLVRCTVLVVRYTGVLVSSTGSLVRYTGLPNKHMRLVASGARDHYQLRWISRGVHVILIWSTASPQEPGQAHEVMSVVAEYSSTCDSDGKNTAQPAAVMLVYREFRE